MSSRDNETHYNKPEGSGEGKSGGRTKKPLSAERAKDKSKRSAKEGGRPEGANRDRPFRENSDRPSFRKEGSSDRPFREKREGDSRPPFRKEGGDRPSFRKEGGGGDRPFREKREGDSRPPFRKEGGDRPFRKEGDKPYGERRDSSDRPSFRKEGGGDRPFREKREGDSRPPFRKEGGDRPFRKEGDKPYGERRDSGDRPSFKKEGGGDRPFREKREGDSRPPFRKEGGDRPFRKEGGSDRPFREKREGDDRPQRPGRDGGDRPLKKYVPFEKREGGSGDSREDRPKRPYNQEGGDRRPSFKGKPGDGPRGRDDRGSQHEEEEPNPFEGEDFYEDERPFTRSNKWDEQAKGGPMTLNKYLAHSGVSSRREAAIIIKDGKVKVNGVVTTEPGYRVKEDDKITYDDKVMTPQKNMVYILLNKPKGFITTTDDEKGRRTVMDLVSTAGGERLYPVGRLDRATTGVLLITNDGDLAQKLSHPSYVSKKIYQVTLTEPLTKRDFDYIIEGNVRLEDGMAPVDALAYLEKKNEIGIEIHSGKNRIVRRIFESLGYVVEKLDRVVYAGLTKKNVSRGKWRFLTEKEIINLKHYKG